jgi:spore germination protein YaaH
MPRWTSRIVVTVGVVGALLLVLAPTFAQAATPGRRMLGYYVPYDPTSWETLTTQADLIDDVAAQWVTIDACGLIGSRDDRTLIQFARSRGIRVFPSLVTFSGWLNNRVLTDEAASSTAVSQIVEYVTSEGYDGFDLDLEGIRPDDRDAYSAFVARVAAALHERGKVLTLAIPAKTGPTTSGWAGAFDYAALGQHADLVTVMAYEFSGPFSKPGSVAPYDWVDRVAKFSTEEIAPEKVLLGVAFYGWDWNTTSGGTKSVSYGQAAALAERYQSPIQLDPGTQSGRFSYQARAGDPPPTRPQPAPLQHEISVRQPPPCAVPAPGPTPSPTPIPTPPPDAIQVHEVWIEESGSAAARLRLASQYGTGGIATWRLGLEDPAVWEIVRQWRASER